MVKPVSCHTLRHAFATYLPEDGDDIWMTQTPPGNQDLNTTVIYTHVLHRGGPRVYSPMDRL